MFFGSGFGRAFFWGPWIQRICFGFELRNVKAATKPGFASFFHWFHRVLVGFWVVFSGDFFILGLT